MNELVALENQFAPLAPQFGEVLGTIMPPERLIRTVLVSVERNAKLLKCNRQSLVNAAMSAAVLGLEVDGVTGQAFLIPFGDRAQLVIGYKGFNTLAARAGITITGEVVREGDLFEYDLGEGYVSHKPSLAAIHGRRIIAAWAKASAKDRPPVVAVMGIAEIEAVKARSPGAKKSDSPWNDPAIGFPAMASKTVKRRLARSTPLSVFQIAAALDEAFEERGRAGYLTPDRNLHIEGEAIAGAESDRTPTMKELTSSGAGEAAEVGDAQVQIPSRLEGEGVPDDLIDIAREKAVEGAGVFNAWYKRLPDEQKSRIEEHKDELRQRMEAAKEPAGG
jgi:recombination protein RecT